MKPAGNQILAEFTDCSPALLQDCAALCAAVSSAISAAGLSLVDLKSHLYAPLGVTVIAIINESHVVLHTYPEAAHVSLDVFTCNPDSSAAHAVVHALKERLQPAHVKLAELQRGRALEMARPGWLQISSTDGMEIALRVEQTLFKARSEFQLLEVVETPQFGKMLLLDNHLQLAACDTELYLDALLKPLADAGCPPKNVLVLGGGDGSAARRLIEAGAGAVTVVDLDPLVTEVSFRYFPELCAPHDSIQFVHAELLQYLDNPQLPPRGFEAIVYDLTMHPEAFTRLPREIYLRSVVQGIAKMLVPGGRLALQCASEYDQRSRRLMEMLLCDYFDRVEFHFEFLPSCCRRWAFASAQSRL